jgi:hypothetical protein
MLTIPAADDMQDREYRLVQSSWWLPAYVTHGPPLSLTARMASLTLGSAHSSAVEAADTPLAAAKACR